MGKDCIKSIYPFQKAYNNTVAHSIFVSNKWMEIHKPADKLKVYIYLQYKFCFADI